MFFLMSAKRLAHHSHPFLKSYVVDDLCENNWLTYEKKNQTIFEKQTDMNMLEICHGKNSQMPIENSRQRERDNYLQLHFHLSENSFRAYCDNWQVYISFYSSTVTIRSSFIIQSCTARRDDVWLARTTILDIHMHIILPQTDVLGKDKIDKALACLHLFFLKTGIIEYKLRSIIWDSLRS